MLKHRCHLCFAVSPSSSSSHTRQLVFAAAPEASAPPGSLAAGILPLCNQRAGLLQPGPSSKQLSCSASTDTHHLSLLPPLCLVIVCVSALLLPLLSVLMLCCGATDVRCSGLTEFRVGRQVCDSLSPVNDHQIIFQILSRNLLLQRGFQLPYECVFPICKRVRIGEDKMGEDSTGY